MLVARPELVYSDLARDLPALDVAMPAAIAAGQYSFHDMGMNQSYCGAPARATAAEGEATWLVLCELLVELVRELASPP